MVDAAREALQFIEGKSQEDLARDRQLALSLVKCLEIVGEAASKVSEQTRRTIPAIPWRSVVGMRNRLIHGYYDIDLARVWDTVNHNLPPLVETLQRAIRPE